MLDAIVGRLIRQYVAEGTCVWKDGGLLAENACLDAAQISDLFEGLAPGVLLPFTIELISVRRGVVSVPLGSILMWRQGNVEVQLEGVNVLLRQRRDDTVTKETIKRSQEQNIRGAMQQMRTLGGAKEEEVAGAPIPELLRRLIGLCRVKVSIKDVHFRYENLAQGDMEVEAGTSAHAAGAVLGRLDLVQDENSSLSGVGTLDLQVADLGAYLKPASHGGADHSASDLELAVGDPRSRRASAQREQEERAREQLQLGGVGGGGRGAGEDAALAAREEHGRAARRGAGGGADDAAPLDARAAGDQWDRPRQHHGDPQAEAPHDRFVPADDD